MSLLGICLNDMHPGRLYMRGYYPVSGAFIIAIMTTNVWSSQTLDPLPGLLPTIAPGVLWIYERK